MTKKGILEKRQGIEKELLVMLKETGTQGPFGLSSGSKTILNEVEVLTIT